MKKYFAVSLVLMVMMGGGAWLIANHWGPWITPVSNTNQEALWPLVTDVDHLVVKGSDVNVVLNSGAEHFMAHVPGIDTASAHAVEYRGSYLYVVKTGTMSSVNGPVMRELWQVDRDGNEKRIFTNPGLDFTVSPNEQTVAVIDGDNVLEVVNMADIQLLPTKYPVSDLANAGSDATEIVFDGWSGDGRSIWGHTIHTEHPNFFAASEVGVDRFPWPAVLSSLAKDMAFNPNTGKLAYSDYPVMFSTDELDAFTAKPHDVTLKVFDVVTEETTTIATNVNMEFHPRWSNDTTLVYTDAAQASHTATVAIVDYTQPVTLSDTIIIRLSKDVTNWSKYTDTTTAVGEDDCSDRPTAFAAYVKDLNTGARSMQYLYGGYQVYSTPNPKHWTNAKFISYANDGKSFCDVGIIYPIQAYPNHLVWGSSCGGVGPVPGTPDGLRLVYCGPVEERLSDIFKTATE